MSASRTQYADNKPPFTEQPEGQQNVRRLKLVTWVGLACNVGLSALKFWVGIVGNSQAVIADAVHSLSDLVTDIAVLVGIGLWTAPADADHPHGHRRIETLITAGIGLALALTAVGLGYRALASVRDPELDAPAWLALLGPVASIIIKEALYRWTAAVGRKARSSAVAANAWHHRSDALSSIPAALAVTAAAISPSLAFMDRIGAVVVALFILKAAWNIARPALEELTDRGAPREKVDRIREKVLDTDGVLDTHAIRTRYLSSGLQVDLHVQVDPEATVQTGHAIAGAVKARLLEDRDILDVIVHIEPHEK